MAKDFFGLHDIFRIYTKADWYWLATDGRVYGSARADFVPAGDEAYEKWLDMGHAPTPWPKDVDGNETRESLEQVLQP
jgi:hypothetical protein